MKNKDVEYLEFRIDNFCGYSNPERDENYSDLYVKIICDDKVIGTMKGVLFNAFYGNDVYDVLDYHSLDYSALCEALTYNDEYDEYVAPWEEDCVANKFVAIGEILLDEEYRGLGITNRLIDWLDKLFNAPMLLLAFPLQYCSKANPNPPKKGLREAKKKVVQAYMKCGFTRSKPKSDILYRMPNF